MIYGRRHIYPQVPKNVTRKCQLPELQTNHSHKQKLVIFWKSKRSLFEYWPFPRLAWRFGLVWKSTGTATTDTRQECEKWQEADSTHQAQKQVSVLAPCRLPPSCVCVHHCHGKSRRQGRQIIFQFLPLLVPIGTLSRRNKSLMLSAWSRVLKAV